MGRGVVTTQRTGKTWKLLQLVGVLLLAGGGWAAISDGGKGSPALPLGILGAIVGGAFLVIGKAGAWWFHG